MHVHLLQGRDRLPHRRQSGNPDVLDKDILRRPGPALHAVDDDDIGTGNTGNIRYSGIMTGNTAQWDAVTGETGGLVANQVYYLSSTDSGNTVNAAPTAASKYVVPVGIGINETDLLIYQRSTVLL
jgi:hypothetical protein